MSAPETETETPPEQRLIALIDGSIYADSVCRHAAWLAGRLGAGATLMHVLGRRETQSTPADMSGAIKLGARSSLLAELSAHDEERAKLAQKRGRAILEDAEGILREAGVAAVQTRLRHGDLLETLADVEGDADILVIGKRGEAADFATGHLGSNLERIARASHRPLFVAARAFKPIETVLIAFDGGPSSRKAADYVARSPLFQGLKCRLLMVGTETAETRRALDEAAYHLRHSKIETAVEIVPGQPETAIGEIVEAGGADMVVMGAYGHSRIRAMIIGSTTAEMLRSCRVPVMLFR